MSCLLGAGMSFYIIPKQNHGEINKNRLTQRIHEISKAKFNHQGKVLNRIT